MKYVVNRKPAACCMCGRDIKPGEKICIYPPEKIGGKIVIPKECKICIGEKEND